jgi:hypothetical protein
MSELIEVILPAEGKRPEYLFKFRTATQIEQSILLQDIATSKISEEEYFAKILKTCLVEGPEKLLDNSLKSVRQLAVNPLLDNIILKVYEIEYEAGWSDELLCETVNVKVDIADKTLDLVLKSPSPKQVSIFKKEVTTSLLNATRKMLKACLISGEADMNDLRLVMTLNLALTEMVSDGESIIAEKKTITS